MGVAGVFVRIGDPGAGEVGEVYRFADWDQSTPQPDRDLLASYVTNFVQAPPTIPPSSASAPVSFAVSPIGDRGGVVGLSHRQDFPDEIDRMLLGVAANQAAIALDRARLLADRERAVLALAEQSEALRTINRVGRALNSQLELRYVVQELTDAATTLSGAQFGAFFYNVMGDEGESYDLFTISGVSRDHFDGFPLPRNTAIFGPTFRGEGVVRLDDVHADPRYGQNPPHHGMPAGHLPLRSYLAMPVLSADGAVLGGIFLGHEDVGVFQDAHEQILTGITAQAGIAITNAELYSEAQNAIRSRDRFLSIASHELRTPVTVIKTSAQLTQQLRRRGPVEEERLDSYLSAIESESNKLSRLIDSLLDVSRLQGGAIPLARSSVDLTELLREVVREQQSISGGHVLGLDIPEHPVLVHADALRVEQVLQNLLTNAIKYSGDSPLVQVELQANEDSAMIRVQDQGMGIPEEMLDQLFRPFARAENASKQSIPGMGLGLYISREIVAAHGGDLELTSRGEGMGTTAVLRLPLPDAEPADASEARL